MMPTLLNAALIQQSFGDNVDVTVLDSISSTNDFFKNLERPLTKKMHCCFAEQQTQGRGRLNRVWHSPFRKNIYFSCYYPFKKNLHELTGLSLVIGLAIIATLKTLGLSENITIKWPNDILMLQKKIAGILIEASGNNIIIGIGINVHMTHEDNTSIDQAWTSLQEATNIPLNRNDIATHLIQTVYSYCQRLEKNGLENFLSEWKSVDGLIGKNITLNYGGELIIGESIGINSMGQLLLRLTDASVRAFASGEVAILKNND